MDLPHSGGAGARSVLPVDTPTPPARYATEHPPPVVLITGADGGLGRATTDLFAAQGWRVIAADLEAPADRHGVRGVAADVTDPGSVRALADQVAAWAGGRLDAVTTFAGILGVGTMVETDPDRIARVLDVNVMGTVRVVQAVFPLLRASGGRVVLIGSETGAQQAMPMNGAYAMSKHAIEAYADALRRELMFLDLDVVLVQPGPFRTGMTAAIRRSFTEAVPAGSPFAAMAAVMGERVAGEDARAADPARLAEAVWRATTATRPRDRYAVGWDRGRNLLSRLPVRTMDRVLRQALGSDIARRAAEGAATRGPVV